jgi:uncharacterized protein YdaU (DUF1376 family)
VTGIVPFYVDRWVGGTRGLSLEQRGAFIDWIAGYAARDGVFPNDLQLFAEVWGCDIRVAKRLRGQLLTKGKLYVDGDLVHQVLIKSVVAKVIAKSTIRADAAFKRWQNHRENNGGTHANASANASDEPMHMHMPSTEPQEYTGSSPGESQQPPPVDNPKATPPQTPQTPQQHPPASELATALDDSALARSPPPQKPHPLTPSPELLKIMTQRRGPFT